MGFFVRKTKTVIRLGRCIQDRPILICPVGRYGFVALFMQKLIFQNLSDFRFTSFMMTDHVTKHLLGTVKL